MKSIAVLMCLLIALSPLSWAQASRVFKPFVIGEKVFHKQRSACGYIADKSQTGTVSFHSLSKGIYLSEVLAIELAREATSGCHGGVCVGDLVYGLERLTQQVNGVSEEQAVWRTGEVLTVFDNGYGRVQIEGRKKLVCAKLNLFVKQ